MHAIHMPHVPCLYLVVCLTQVGPVDPVETAEPIEVPFGGQPLVGSRNLVLYPQ